VLYLDTSALAKLYLVEPESSAVERMLHANSPWIATSRVTYAETLSVLARCQRDRRISPASYKVQKKVFLADWSTFHIVELTAAVLSHAARQIERHALGGFDAIHLCSALWIGQPLFACFDDRLRNAAVAAGLPLAN
jgi:predicted nucleic acid-binding protein